jgi:prephenate dehydratase
MLPHCTVVPCQRSAEVFQCVESGKTQGAVIPIENTLAGSVAEHYDLLLHHNAFILQEFRLRIVHNLIASQGVKIKNIKRVFSHPVALEQCRDFFRKHTRIQTIPFYDTAGSVRHVVEEDLRDAAAIASVLAAEEYNGAILKRGLEDNKKNFTRFFFIRKTKKIPTGANKTTLAFSLKNEPGVLFKALGVFALRNIDLSKIESRPVPGKPWEYVFYADAMRGNDKVMQNALRHLEEIAEFVKVLGVYPKSL